MGYTLDQYSADCRAALLKDPGPAGREIVRQYTEKASTDPEFVAKYLGPDADAERRILYEDPDLHFCILAHVYKGAKKQLAARPRPELGDLQSGGRRHGNDRLEASRKAGERETRQGREGPHLRPDARQSSRLQRGRCAFTAGASPRPA